MARHAICCRVIGLDDCTACRRNPVNAHPLGDWSDDWQAPVIDTAGPLPQCRSREVPKPAEVAA